jgi:hypothetical protein
MGICQILKTSHILTMILWEINVGMGAGGTCAKVAGLIRYILVWNTALAKDIRLQFTEQ